MKGQVESLDQGLANKLLNFMGGELCLEAVLLAKLSEWQIIFTYTGLLQPSHLRVDLLLIYTTANIAEPSSCQQQSP